MAFLFFLHKIKNYYFCNECKQLVVLTEPDRIISNLLRDRFTVRSLLNVVHFVAANKALMGLKGDSRAGSRRGSMVPRSRGGSIQLGGAERRGSYYEEGVTQRATVAMVTDDPEHKKNVKAGLAGAFDDAAISEYNPDTSFLCKSLFIISFY